jgi:hypothetical protein
MMRPRAGIICPHHGKVDLLEPEYWEQLENSSSWYCPICHNDATFDRSRFEELENVPNWNGS